MHSDLNTRRKNIKSIPNSDRNLDYITTLKSHISISSKSDEHLAQATLIAHYVPDRFILTPKSFKDFIEIIEAIQWESVEEMTVAILTDLNNELVPRWIRIETMTAASNDTNATHHSVLIEDQQPDWNNHRLLKNLN